MPKAVRKRVGPHGGGMLGCGLEHPDDVARVPRFLLLLVARALEGGPTRLFKVAVLASIGIELWALVLVILRSPY